MGSRLLRVALVLAFLPGVQAEGTPRVLATAVDASGMVDLDGHLLAWVLPSPAGGASLALHASELRVRQYQWSNGVGPENGALALAMTPKTYGDASLHGAPWANVSFLQVFQDADGPAPRIQFSTSAVRLAPDGRSCIRDPSELQSVPVCYDATSGGAVSQVPQPLTLAVSGSFQVKFWGWSGQLATPDGASAFWSGHEHNTVASQRALNQDRWGMFNVHVADGTLTVVLHQQTLGDLALADALVTTDGAAAIATADGGLLHAGPGALAVSFQDARMAVTPQSAPVPAPPSRHAWLGSAWPWLTGAGLLALAGAGAAAAIARRRPDDPVLRALHAKDPFKAARLAALAGPSPTAEPALPGPPARSGQPDRGGQDLRAYAPPAADLEGFA
ncbi:MAG: hypothetical protein QOI63_1463 [Thermoplasmata archaeon]|nr:hypothetical protein [Thermoplasmata archaeon]